jgi:trans-aconitate methyltransferase
LKVHNVRSPEQWEIISRHIDFKDKTVLDLGCGRGDILRFAFEAGATVVGIDKDEANVEYICNSPPEVVAVCDDIETIGIIPPTNIIICFSVLPYLIEPGYMLQWINQHSDVALIECQYAGDGPGFDFLTNNDEMETWLLEVGNFIKVKSIGYTLVQDRNKERHIWMCE